MTLRLVIDRSDTTWSDKDTPRDRLVWVRLASGLSQEAFGKAIGKKRGAYLLYEAPEGQARRSNVDFELAQEVERKHGVWWRWLLLGEDTPWTKDPAAERPAIVSEIADLAASAAPEDQELIRDMARRMARKTG